VTEAIRPEETPYGTLVHVTPRKIFSHIVGVAASNPSTDAVPHRAVIAFPDVHAGLESLLRGPEVIVGGLFQKAGLAVIECFYATFILSIGGEIAGIVKVLPNKGGPVQASLLVPVADPF